MRQRTIIYSLAVMFLVLVVTACGATPTPTVPPPTPTIQPQAQPTAVPTAVPPTATKPAPTATPVPPTATAVPATATPVPATATPAPTKATVPVTSSDAKDAIIKALRSQMTSKPLRANVTTQTGTQSTPIMIEFVPPDNYHLTTSAGAAGNFEMIITGGKAYQKTGDTWALFPVDVASLIQQFTSDTSDAAIGSISNVQLVGPDVVDGAPMMVYTYTDTMTVAGQTTTSNVKVWIGVSDGLPHKAITDSDTAGVKSTTTETITYDPSIKIVAPM